MTKYPSDQVERLNLMQNIFDAIVYKQEPPMSIRAYQEGVAYDVTPDDVVVFVHRLIEQSYDMEIIKSGISKLLNVLRTSLENAPYEAPAGDSFFGVCISNNEEVIDKLTAIRPIAREINQSGLSDAHRSDLHNRWSDIKRITDYYLIKENILFPLLEEHLPDYRCISVMWSIHDDIRRNLNEILEHLQDSDSELQQLNNLMGKLFFDIYAIVFREERLLYPFIKKNIPLNQIEALWNESVESGFPYLNPAPKEQYEGAGNLPNDIVDLKTGLMSVEQIIMVFNHLPVDITYVDENDRVLFFSTPKDRIFHRTKAVIGRDVHNCHPKESVHVVEKIVEAFRNKTKDSASFWISMRSGKRVLIQYFAVRDEAGEYRGVIEVSQEISEIQKLEGDRRILDWEE